MDLWGAGINFILDGEKNQKGQKNFEKFLGQVLKNETRDAKILE